MPETKAEDDTGMSPYEIDGYDWEMKSLRNLGQGDLIPGHNGEVYEIQKEAGMSMDYNHQYYLTVIIYDGNINHLVRFQGDRSKMNDAMKDRTCVEMFPTESDIWTLVEA
jgi:hypothetical protein